MDHQSVDQPTVTDMTEACSKVDTPQYIAAIQAGVCTEQVGKILQEQCKDFLKMLEALCPVLQLASPPQVMSISVEMLCFKCRKHGNMRKNCPELTKGTKASSLCPRCRRGKHHANQFYSKTDMDGKPLPIPGNSKKSAGHQCAVTHVMTVPLQGTPQGFPVPVARQPLGNIRQIPSAGHLPVPQRSRITTPRRTMQTGSLQISVLFK